MAFFNIDMEMVNSADEINKEEAKSFSTPSGFYPVRINVAYLTEGSTSEAAGLTIEYIAEGWKYPKRETMWFQGRDGSTTRMAKKRDGTEYPDETFGMKQVRGLCAITDVNFEAIETSDGIIETKDGQKRVKIFADFTGKTLTVGLQEVIEDKYGDESESRNVTNIVWVGRSDTDEEGVMFPWGRVQKAEKFASAIAKVPVIDERELSKPGAIADGAAEAAAAFGSFGA